MTKQVISESLDDPPAIAVHNLTCRFGTKEAIKDLTLTVRPGTVYGLFGSNGAGKTSTIKCLLNLLSPANGSIRIFGLDPFTDEKTVKHRLAYVPDTSVFYPWMSVRQVLDYFGSFRADWDTRAEHELLRRFRLDPKQRAATLSKGQATQLTLTCAICARPELLILDEPTTGLDPVIRRQFVDAVISEYRGADPQRRTVLVSTHLISEFEEIIDDFSILEQGRTLLSASAREARQQFHHIHARFAAMAPTLTVPGLIDERRRGRDIDLIISGSPEPAMEQLRSAGAAPELIHVQSPGLESLFVALLNSHRNGA